MFSIDKKAFVFTDLISCVVDLIEMETYISILLMLYLEYLFFSALGPRPHMSALGPCTSAP